MTDTVENLILDLVEWVACRERTYQETMDAWRTSCPKLPVWEDANLRGLVETVFVNGRSLVRRHRQALPFSNNKDWLRMKNCQSPHAEKPLANRAFRILIRWEQGMGTA